MIILGKELLYNCGLNVVIILGHYTNKIINCGGKVTFCTFSLYILYIVVFDELYNAFTVKRLSVFRKALWNKMYYF